MVLRNVLTEGWTGRLAADEPGAFASFPATVPGGVYQDLLAAGLIPDPFDGDNEKQLRWIGDSDWTFATTFDAPEGGWERTDLVFHGLDTIARILVNGDEVAATENMHRTYRIPVTGLHATGNTLEVRFSAPRRVGAERRDAYGKRPVAFDDVSPFLRKMQCDFGWDWGPDLAPSGIWRDVVLEAWSTARLASVRPIVGVDARDRGTVRFEVELERASEAPVTVRASVAGVTVSAEVTSGETSVTLVAEVDHVDRWWPRGRGEQPLYDAVVELVGLDEWRGRIGFRDIEVEQIEDADAEGSNFRVRVNGEPIFIRGVNWIPDSSYIAAVGRERYRERLGQGVALGINLVRVWGGGVFESDDFYDACDELGILVWQDFLFACAAYPEEDPFTGEVEAEARDNITRLMSHASLAIWNGNNECVWFWFLHDWETVLEGKTWGEKFYFELLPSLVAELDPQRFYLAGSPYSGARDREPLDPRRGVVHSWVPGDYREYEAIRPRFVSEFGFQGPPTRELFDSVVHDPAPTPFAPAVAQHQKAVYGTERIEDVMRIHTGIPADFDDWYWTAQLTQARAVRFGIDYFRSLSPWCSGTIVWQLNDCWPVISWSMIDSSTRWKPAAYALRTAFADRVVSLHRVDGVVRIALGNESRDAWTYAARIERWHPSGPRGTATVPFSVEPLSTAWLELPAEVGQPAADELVVVTVGDLRGVILGGVDLDFADAPASFELDVAAAGDGVDVTVTAGSLLRDTCLFPGSIDENSHSDKNLITLLPGESATWHVSTAHASRFDADALRPLVRTARAV